jgi:nucleoside-diphosphate-sugar epimerase
MKRILVTGAAGQVGTELVPALRAAYGAAEVLATDLKPGTGALLDGPYQQLDCMDGRAVADAAARHKTDTIYHLAALLSATAEKNPLLGYTLNMGTLLNVLEVAREARLAVFVPSSIAAFGPSSPRDPTPQDTIQRPTSMYGVTKVAGELLCDYYHLKYGLDTRGLRYPGLISYVAPPGGGTTDYAVEIFYEALESNRYTCFLRADTQLDMMYMPDAVRASIEVMEAPAENLDHRNAFNIAAMQLTPATLAEMIADELPGFTISYEVDPVKQKIADSWPLRLDDSAARTEWGWRPEYDARAMVKDMIGQLRMKLNATR